MFMVMLMGFVWITATLKQISTQMGKFALDPFIHHDPCPWNMLCVRFAAHQNRVSDMVFSLESEWVVSTGHDKSVSWMCTQSGSMLGRHYFNAWASCLQYPSFTLLYMRLLTWCFILSRWIPDFTLRYDHETQHAFVGDYSGQITLLKLEKQTYSTITTLKGHEGKDTRCATVSRSGCRLVVDLSSAQFVMHTKTTRGCPT